MSSDGEHIVVRAGDQARRLHPGDRCVIGRADSADLHLDERTVSRRHAAVSFRDGQIWLEDLGSRRGTYLDGDRITGPTVVNRSGTINLADPDGPAVTVEELGAAPANRTRPERTSAIRRLGTTISEHRLLAAAAVFVIVAGIVAVRLLSPDDSPSAGDQLVVATIHPSTQPAQTGTAVVIDGELGLVAVPRISDPDDVTSYIVQIPLDDGRLFDVAAVRLDGDADRAADEDVDVVQLVGTSVNPDLVDRLEGYAKIDTGELGDAPEELWTYSTDAEGLPAPTRVSTSASGGDSISTDEPPTMAFAPVIDGGSLVGFGAGACTSTDGRTSLRVIDTNGIAAAIDDAAEVSETVGPAPVLSTGLASFTPEPCTDE